MTQSKYMKNQNCFNIAGTSFYLQIRKHLFQFTVIWMLEVSNSLMVIDFLKKKKQVLFLNP